MFLLKESYKIVQKYIVIFTNQWNPNKNATICRIKKNYTFMTNAFLGNVMYKTGTQILDD